MRARASTACPCPSSGSRGSPSTSSETTSPSRRNVRGRRRSRVQSAMTADEKFISRWSRLKTEARQTEAKPPEPKADVGPAMVATPPAAPKDMAPAPAAPELPSIESLKGLASEYTEFLKPGVDEGLRRAALKKLFSDPYFETFEN